MLNQDVLYPHRKLTMTKFSFLIPARKGRDSSVIVLPHAVMRQHKRKVPVKDGNKLSEVQLFCNRVKVDRCDPHEIM